MKKYTTIMGGGACFFILRGGVIFIVVVTIFPLEELRIPIPNSQFAPNIRK